MSLGLPLLNAEHFLGCISDIEEAIFIVTLRINVGQSLGEVCHASVIDEQVEGLASADLQPVSDDGHKLGHRELLGNQEFCLV